MYRNNIQDENSCAGHHHSYWLATGSALIRNLAGDNARGGAGMRLLLIILLVLIVLGGGLGLHGGLFIGSGGLYYGGGLGLVLLVVLVLLIL